MHPRSNWGADAFVSFVKFVDLKSSRLSVLAWGNGGADAFVSFVKFVDQKTSRLGVLAWSDLVFVVFIVFLFGGLGVGHEPGICRLYCEK